MVLRLCPLRPALLQDSRDELSGECYQVDLLLTPTTLRALRRSNQASAQLAGGEEWHREQGADSESLEQTAFLFSVSGEIRERMEDKCLPPFELLP